VRPLIIEVPSPLGLRPSGVELAPEALRAAGLHSLLSCELDYRDLRAGTIPLILDRALATVTKPELQGFWVHFDVDVLDDTIMPAVDYRYEGGLSWDEAAQLLQGLLSRPGARGLEVTIFNPNLDPGGSIARQLCDLIGRCVPTAA
jgi:arginase